MEDFEQLSSKVKALDIKIIASIASFSEEVS